MGGHAEKKDSATKKNYSCKFVAMFKTGDFANHPRAPSKERFRETSYSWPFLDATGVPMAAFQREKRGGAGPSIARQGLMALLGSSPGDD